MKQSIETEVAVIGAGPGGYTAAFRAADLGKNVTIIEMEKALGGVCLNHGCIPSKALLHISKVIHEADSVKYCGVNFQPPQIDLDKLRGYKEKVVSQLNRGIVNMVKARKINVLHGIAKFDSKNRLSIQTKDDEVKLSFQNAIISTGSSPKPIHGFPMDHPNLLTSTEALQLHKIPESLLIVGGGYIGLEMGSVYQILGSKVTVAEFMPILLPGADPDLVKPLFRNLSKKFEEIFLSTKVGAIHPDIDGSIKVELEKEHDLFERTFESVLVSVGRKPNTHSLGLEKIGIEVDGHGFIKVDKKQQTNVSNIFAIGDVTGNPMLAHKATHEGRIAAEVITGLPAAFDVRGIPAVIFTDPEIAWVGLTETEAVSKHIPFEKGEFPWAANGRSLAMGRNEGRTKILFDPETKRVLGVGIVGPSAGDLISEAVLAIELGADAEDISLTIHPHPTLSETVANAAEVFSGTVTDLYIPPKK